MSSSHSDPKLDLVEALATSVVLLDRDLRVLRVNGAAESLLAISGSKVLHGLLTETVPGTDELAAAARRALDEGRSFSERDLALQLGNLSVTVDFTVSPLWLGSEMPDRVLLEMTNVERHQRIQWEGNMLIQNNVTAALLQGLAHEIKNPLGGIRGAAQLLERELEDRKHEEYTQIIIGEVDRLRTVVDRMLGPREMARRQQVNIHDVLEHVRQVAEVERENSVEILRDYDPSIPDVLGDRHQLIQAFLNLVRNAVQAVNGGGGTVTLRTRVKRQFTIGTKLHRLVVRVQVIDTGPGVDPELAHSIFFPLVSGRADGSGLGLPITQTLLHRQGGLIGFESEPGRTVFSVWLPVGEGE